MVFRWRKRNEAVGLVVGEHWLTTAWLVTKKIRGNKNRSILGARQSIKVVMLCQRPIHTHNLMSLAQLISSNLGHNYLKRKPKLLIRRPFISLQLPERLYQTLDIEKPTALKLTGPWAAATLADEGYNLNEWRWDLCIQGNHCRFLLMKAVDFHQYLQPLQEAGCMPNAINYINPADIMNTQPESGFLYLDMAVLPDALAAQQAISLARQNLGF